MVNKIDNEKYNARVKKLIENLNKETVLNGTVFFHVAIPSIND